MEYKKSGISLLRCHCSLMELKRRYWEVKFAKLAYFFLILMNHPVSNIQMTKNDARGI